MPKEDDEEQLWPHGEKPGDVEAFFDLVKELGDAKTQKEVEKAEAELARVKAIAAKNGFAGHLLDMPEEVLDGRLGEICATYMTVAKRFPVAYAWPALLAMASVCVPRHSVKQRLNLYVAIVGPLHSGKSQAIAAAQQLLGVEPPVLLNIMVGSAESLARKCKDAAGNPRLFSPDELGHLLDKSKIENASFPYILNRAFYDTRFELHMGKKELAMFDASLSILGGLPDGRFEDLFSHSTTGGLYDRFAFGACPGGYEFDYYPFEIDAVRYEPKSVYIHEDVWIEKSAWKLEQPELEPRVVEIAIRAAAVCAAFDGRTLLRAEDLRPARAFVCYQQRIRQLLKPNEGETIEAKVALKILNYLDRLEGKYVTRRKLLHDIGAYRYGPSVADRTMDTLHANGEIEVAVKKRPVLVRRILADEAGREE